MDEVENHIENEKLLSVEEFKTLYKQDRHGVASFRKEPFVNEKGWGKELVCYDEAKNVNSFYCQDRLQTVKVLYFEKGKKCSLHYHSEKYEVFHLLKGRLLVEFVWSGKKHRVMMYEQEYVCIDRNLIHQMTGLDNSNILLEISTQDKENDSYRISKGD